MAQILLVDDSPDLLNVLNWSLRRHVYSCAMACYKAGIFHKLSRIKPSLIILDVNLNGDDGRTICTEIKETPATAHIPLILCSGNHELLHNYKFYLADDYIEKPFEIKSVLKKIERFFIK